MFHPDSKTENFSGYLKINENLLIEEFSGQINQILRKENFDPEHVSFLQMTESLKKNHPFLFRKRSIACHKR